MKPPEQIETERLILRKPRMDDAPAMFAGWTQDPEVTYFLMRRSHENIEQTESILTWAIGAWNGNERFPFMVTLKESGDVIGMIDAHIENHKVAIGYVMNRKYQGNGYMTESARAMIEWAFGQPSIYRVYATTDVENIASRRVMEKAGMQREGILRRYVVQPNISNEPRDSYMYAIVR